MRVRDLYSEVAQLGFETNLDEPVRFYQAINRGLLEVCSVRPTVKRLEIPHYPIRCHRVMCGEEVHTDHDLVYCATSPKAYYFEAYGNLSFAVEHKTASGWETVKDEEQVAENGFVAHKGFVKQNNEFLEGEVRIRFFGDFRFVVKNVAFYDEIVSYDENDIPAADEYTRYDLNKLTDDFFEFDEVPMMYGYPIDEKSYVVLERSVLMVSNRLHGTVTIEYSHKPTPIEFALDPYHDDTDVDLDDELCTVLPLLLASYLWLDDDSDKSLYYRTLYTERVQQILTKKRMSDPVKTNYNGW